MEVKNRGHMICKKQALGTKAASTPATEKSKKWKSELVEIRLIESKL